jgi:hypothetical protein
MTCWRNSSRAAVDGSHIRALQGRAKTGRSPGDRGQDGHRHHLITDATGIPLVPKSSQAMWKFLDKNALPPSTAIAVRRSTHATA